MKIFIEVASHHAFAAGITGGCLQEFPVAFVDGSMGIIGAEGELFKTLPSGVSIIGFQDDVSRLDIIENLPAVFFRDFPGDRGNPDIQDLGEPVPGSSPAA